MDLTIISNGLASLQSAIELTKIIGSASGALEKAELKLKLAEILSALADAKISMSEAGTKIAELEDALRDKRRHDAAKTWFKDGLYVLVDDHGSPLDGPFCGRCFDVDFRLVRPATDGPGQRGMGYCPQCKNRYPLWNAEQKLSEKTASSSLGGSK